MGKHTLHQLKDIQIKHANGPSKLQDGGGLSVKVTAADQKSFVFRYTWDGVRIDLGLGGYPSVSLAQARDKAAEARKWLNQTPKRDPKSEWKAQTERIRLQTLADKSATVTFGAYAETYISNRQGTWKTMDTADQWRRSLQKHCRPIWDQPIRSIDFKAVESCLAPIWVSKHVTATRVRNRMESILDSATIQSLRDGENPAKCGLPQENWSGN